MMHQTCKAGQKMVSRVLTTRSVLTAGNTMLRSQKTKKIISNCRYRFYSTDKPEDSGNNSTLSYEYLKNLSHVPRPLQIAHLLQQDLPYLIKLNAPEEQVVHAFEKLLEIGCATIYSYTITISYLGKRGRADLALEYWNQLKEQQDIRPNERTYQAIISAVCRGGDLAKAEELLKEALQRRIKNKAQLYKTVLMDYFFFNRGVDPEGISRAEKLFLESLSLEADEANKLEMFEVMAKLYAKNGLTKKITHLLSELTKRNIQPTVNFMNSLMEVYLHDDNMSDAMLVFSSFTTFKLTPNAITYSILLLKLLKHAKATNYAPDKESDEKIEATFKAMRSTIKDTIHSKSAYTDMIQYYFMRDLPEKGNEIFDLMRNNGLADVIAYNVMIDYYREVDIEYAFTLFDEMFAKNISPNMITYLLLIDYYCKVNQIDEAFDLLAQAKSRNLHPNVATYTTLIDYLGKTNRYDRIEVLLKEMIEVGVNPNEHTFAVLVNNLIRAKKFARAYSFVKEMGKFGLRPNRVVYTTLFDGILNNVEAASSHADSFIKLVHSNQQDFPLDEAVKYYAERRKNQRIIALWKMLDEYGLELSEETEAFLKELLNKDENEREAKREAEASTEQEREDDKSYYRSVPLPNFRSEMWHVHKFGGTSVSNYVQVGNIVLQQKLENKERKLAVVVSAMSGITDELIQTVETAKLRDDKYLEKIQKIVERHHNVINEVLKSESLKEQVRKSVDSDASNLRDILRSVYLLANYSANTLEVISGYGELWSAQILSAHLQERSEDTKSDRVTWLDSRQVLFVQSRIDSHHSSTPVVVDMETSATKLNAWMDKASELNPSIIIVTGYIATDLEGTPTTLGRNGSDFSAAIFAALLKAEKLIIWKDVDGVQSADPRKVPTAQVLTSLSYEEAMELAYFGAKILHPRTMEPAVKLNIPIELRNTFRPERHGTLICSSSQSDKLNGHTDSLIKGVSNIDDIALINVEGPGMAGVPGVAQKLFSALHHVNVNVIMISQASSEHSICFAVSDKSVELARAAVQKEFFREIHLGEITNVDAIKGCSIIAAVGDNMRKTTGVSGRLFGALGVTGVNVMAIAQGSSERNISIVVSKQDVTSALNAIHDSLVINTGKPSAAVSGQRTVNVGVIGLGVVGSALLNQFSEQLPVINQELNIAIKVKALMSSSKLITSKNSDSIELQDIVQASKVTASNDKFEVSAASVDQFLARVRVSGEQTIIVDNTSSMDIAQKYPEWLAQGISVVTPNKKAFSSQIDLYYSIKKIVKEKKHVYCLHETTVGAALPVLSSLRDLIRTGDKIQSIEGVLSGTLSYLFNTFSDEKNQQPFSAIVADAKAKGYTEPDPRDDLSGLDVARKVIILARESGLNVSLDSVTVKSLVPQELESVSVEEFMAKYPLYDEKMSQMQKEAQEAHKVLRFVGSIQIQNGQASVSVELKQFDQSHPFAALKANDNMIAFTTKRYSNRPLVVQGPGAGAEVTASGVFADLLHIVHSSA